MAKYQVAHGVVKAGGKRYEGSKLKPGEGETFEASLDPKVEKHLLASGTIVKVDATPEKKAAPEKK